MNIAAIASQLLSHFSPEERAVPDAVAYPGRNAAVAMAMNAALQELFGKAGPWVRTEDKGHLLNAPTTVSIAVTNGSASGTITGWAAWMAGCSIVIDGSSIDNVIKNDSASVTLKIPYDGTTGTKSATVYHDCITTSTDVMEVHAPVKVDGREIFPVPNGDYAFHAASGEDYGFHRRISDPPVPPRVAESMGLPVVYQVETWSKDATTAAQPRIHIQPAPETAGVIEYKALIAPPVVTDIASTSVLPVPLQFIQTLFYPIARQRLKASAFYRSGPGESEAERAYADALAMIKDRDPAPSKGVQLRSMY